MTLNERNITGFMEVAITGGLAISDKNIFTLCCPRPGGKNSAGKNSNKEI